MTQVPQPRINVRGTSGLYGIAGGENETVLDAIRRVGLPAIGFMLSDPDGAFVSLSDFLSDHSLVTAQALRNPDLDLLMPSYDIVRVEGAVSEVFEYGGSPPRPVLRQLRREDVADAIFASVASVVDRVPEGVGCQVALSSGGDGRALAEGLSRYRRDRRSVAITAVITSVGFEDPESHVREAVSIAECFALPYEIYDEAGAAQLLGYRRELETIARDFSAQFPRDELEALGTYWVQQVNLMRARETSRQFVMFGYNLEDVIADRLYQLLSSNPLPPYPSRAIGEDLTLLAPLHQVSKRVIDSLDLDNSHRNYEVRVPSGSYLRSALYFVAYHIAERFPPLAYALASEPTHSAPSDRSDAIAAWLATQ